MSSLWFLTRSGVGVACCVTLIVALVLPGQVAADPSVRLVATPQLSARRTLTAISAAELLGGAGLAHSLGTWRGPQSLHAALKRPQLTVTRDLPVLWRLVSDPEIDVASLTARYHVAAGADGSGSLVHDSDSSSRIGVSILPLRPRVVSRTARQAQLEGGVRLILDLSEVRRSGHYSGRLRYTISSF